MTFHLLCTARKDGKDHANVLLSFRGIPEHFKTRGNANVSAAERLAAIRKHGININGKIYHDCYVTVLPKEW
jgi:hypothetical protein